MNESDYIVLWDEAGYRVVDNETKGEEFSIPVKAIPDVDSEKLAKRICNELNSVTKEERARQMDLSHVTVEFEIEKAPFDGSRETRFDWPLPDQIILDNLDRHPKIAVYKSVVGERRSIDWVVWDENDTGGGLIASCGSDQLAFLVAHAMSVLQQARRVGPLREQRR